MIRFFVIVILTGLILIFQNCSTGKNFTNSNSIINLQNTQLGSDKVIVLPMDLRTTLSMQINNVRNTKAMEPQDLLVKPDIYYYLVNIADGKIQAFDMNNIKLNYNFCLSDGDKSELINILQTGQICEPNPEGDLSSQEDRVCTMNYVMPYAKLNFSNHSSFSLGERSSGCDIPTDLCGDHSTLLKGFVRNFLLNISTKTCN
jgi:hypothetical protein